MLLPELVPEVLLTLDDDEVDPVLEDGLVTLVADEVLLTTDEVLLVADEALLVADEVLLVAPDGFLATLAELLRLALELALLIAEEVGWTPAILDVLLRGP